MSNPPLSSASFAAIQGMANAVLTVPAFDAYTVSALRHELGDWQNPMKWPKEVFDDLQARSSFYGSLGVSPAH